MAESAVEFVLSKLGDMIVKEVEHLGSVGEKVKWAQTELMDIRCYLKDADSKRCKGNTTAENWLNQLRDVAYRIEDATDTFYLEVEDNRHNDPSFLHKLKKLCHKPMEVPVLHKLATELDDIKKVLEGISNSKSVYSIDPLQDRGKGNTIVMPFRRAAYLDVDETEVVGLDADKNKILKLLRYEETPRRAVITIVGTGGLGKTTLAHMVYKSAKADFKYHIMLSVSEQFSLPDLLRKMLSKLKHSVPKKQDVGALISELRDLLNSKRYLIILDDVWGAVLWNQLKDALPDVKNGSRVLMTSRFIDVAKSADPRMAPYELCFLSDEHSLDLFLRKAVPSEESDEKCPSDLLELANALSKKCKGLPLALIVLGGIISTKEQTYHAWKRVFATMDWHSDGKDCMNVLAMSYEDMPYYLKSCFLYLSSFPEDYEITATRLVNMWVAEGFIPQQDRKTMEETAEDCLEQLFQRSMIQVSSRSPNGSIKYCRVHDLLRDLAMHQAGKENFVTVFPQPQGINHLSKLATRRASLQSCSPHLMESVGPYTRSLLWFGRNDSVPSYSEFKLLRVLEIVGVNMSHITNLKGLDKLIHLKYLGFRNCYQLNVSTSSFGRLKNLQTLDLRGTKMERSPTGLWTIGTLRHVLTGGWIWSGPPSRVDLINLQTLKWVCLMETWLSHVPGLSNLKTLGLSNPYSEWWDPVPNLLGTLTSLVSLGIRTHSENHIPKEIVYPRALANYQNLQNLYLDGVWSEDVTLEAGLFPPYLVKLTLMSSNFRQDPMMELGKLKSLKKLRLDHIYKGMQMICQEGFTVLESLILNERLDVFTIAKGGMPKLKYLGYSTLFVKKLEVPPELKHSTSIVNLQYKKFLSW
ncbi:Disease resistance family protein [Rhynchospora pubera]|uniref:Disease resistance family protein n=1 Tax=Rhynchospora pubera TaxID=906938 RepID=A0AAV8F8A8_9POAL|nr:Disease resistance family protein [Rhynchospora pubera]